MQATQTALNIALEPAGYRVESFRRNLGAGGSEMVYNLIGDFQGRQRTHYTTTDIAAIAAYSAVRLGINTGCDYSSVERI